MSKRDTNELRGISSANAGDSRSGGFWSGAQSKETGLSATHLFFLEANVDDKRKQQRKVVYWIYAMDTCAFRHSWVMKRETIATRLRSRFSGSLERRRSW